jgi:hypothetical protein
MAENEKAAKAAGDAERTSGPAPAKQVEVEKPIPKKTKIVAETGRYVCKHPIVFTSPSGKRTIARAGEIVAIHDDDVPALKKRRVIESEEESAEA